MSSVEFDLLGPAEKHIAKQLHNAFAECEKPMREIAEKLDKLVGVDFEAVMLDPKKKDSAVGFLDVVSTLPRRLSDMQLALLLADVIFAEKDGVAS